MLFTRIFSNTLIFFYGRSEFELRRILCAFIVCINMKGICNAWTETDRKFSNLMNKFNDDEEICHS